MSSNSNGGGGGNNNNGNSETYVAIVALVISVIAFMATSAQVVQQYLASAQGYSQCNEKVMGQWAKTRRRKLIWYETRFEVEYDIPVIFVCPPNNERGPINKINGESMPIYLVTGTDASYNDTWTTREEDPRADMSANKKSHKDMVKERIHTADNERASWSVLLSAVQSMERKSAEWQKGEYSRAGPPGKGQTLLDKPPELRESHTLTVALQRKRRSWDTMPKSITKPYATTTICHLIEIMAALGVYWKEFDRKNDRYRAEGNGYMVLGERISDLGLMFSFQLYGQSDFGRNRIIPVQEVKDLCFGRVPTVFRSAKDEAVGLNSLALATQREVSETLTAVGCNKNTVHYFLEEGSRTSHLFPVAFELVGMLSQTFHIPNSGFTYIPNPTADRWEKGSVSVAKMLDSYAQLFQDPLPGIERNPIITNMMNTHMANIRNLDDAQSAYHLRRANALHAALDDLDEVLTARVKRRFLPDSPTLKNSSRWSIQTTSIEAADKQVSRRIIVQDVLRSHIQEVLRLLNLPEDFSPGVVNLQVPLKDGSPSRPFSPGSGGPRYSYQARSPSRRPRSRNRALPELETGGDLPTTFEDMNDASPDERQQRFMEVYFKSVRKRVVSHSSESTERRASMSAKSPHPAPFTSFHGGISAVTTGASPAPPGFGFKRRETSKTTTDGDNIFPAVKENIRGPRLSLDDVAMKNGPVVAVEAGPEQKAQLQVGEEETVEMASIDERSTGEEEHDDDDDAASAIEPMTVKEPDFAAGERERPFADENVSHDDIWCVLVLRMICWLMLHDFDPADVQMPKSELRGSRMPVYIS